MTWTPKVSEYSSTASAATFTMSTVDVEPLGMDAFVPFGTAVKSAGETAVFATVPQVKVTAFVCFAESWTANATIA